MLGFRNISATLYGFQYFDFRYEKSLIRVELKLLRNGMRRNTEVGLNQMEIFEFDDFCMTGTCYVSTWKLYQMET